MKLNLKVVEMVVLSVGLFYMPAFSTSYEPDFIKTMNVQPAEASVEQLRAFYQKYDSKNQKSNVMVQMAAWKGIALFKDGMPSVQFLDFALTIENKLPAADESILTPIYKHFIHNIPYYEDDNIAKWKKNIDEVLGKKTVWIEKGEYSTFASHIARDAIFEAVLQYYVEHNNYANPIGFENVFSAHIPRDIKAVYGELPQLDYGKIYDHRYRMFIMPKVEVFAVNHRTFGLNSAKRRDLMERLSRNVMEAVAQNRGNLCGGISYRYHSPGEIDTHIVEEVPGSACQALQIWLSRFEKAIKASGGKGFDIKDPNYQQYQLKQAEVTVRYIGAKLGVRTNSKLHKL